MADPRQSIRKRPTILGKQFEDVVFYDWTSDGHLLVNLKHGGKWQLAILDKEGKLRRIINTKKPPAPRGWIASWRHYRHF